MILYFFQNQTANVASKPAVTPTFQQQQLNEKHQAAISPLQLQQEQLQQLLGA